jgi:hypothetical protein
MALHAAPAVAVRELSDDYCEFELSGVDAAFANALRRVMIADVSGRKSGGWSVCVWWRADDAGLLAGER